jgi:RNase adaptor protein for sRNA GlmZ degradation
VADDVERVDGIVEKVREQVSAIQTQVAVLQASQLDLVKRWDESDRRRWTVYGVMLAAALTFVANLVLLFLKR